MLLRATAVEATNVVAVAVTVGVAVVVGAVVDVVVVLDHDDHQQTSAPLSWALPACRR